MNNKGFTILEVLVTTVVGGITAYMVASYMTDLNKLHQQLKLRRLTGEAVHSIAESIRFNLSYYQVTFDNSVTKELEVLTPSKLPLGVSKGSVIQKSECATRGCEAYMGYLIIPSEFVRNLYQVKFKIVSAKDMGVSWDKTYTYFITVK